MINKKWESSFLPGILLREIKKKNAYGINAEYREFHIIIAMETYSTESICPSIIKAIYTIQPAKHFYNSSFSYFHKVWGDTKE